MQSAPVFQVLQALPPSVLRALDKFMASPYHVTHAGAGLLYRYLRARLPEAPAAELEKAVVARQLGESPERLYHLTSYLLEAIEQFLALEAWKRAPEDGHVLVVEALRRLHLDGLSAGMLRYARRRLEGELFRSAAYHRADYRLQLEAYHLSQQQGRAKAFNLQELSDAQDVAFISEKLRTGCLLLSHQSVSKRAYDDGLLKPVLAFLKGHAYLKIPSVAAYYHGYFAQAGGADSDAHFRQLKTILDSHADRFPVSEVHDLYLMAINFCIRRINQAEGQYFRDVFDLYQSGLQHGALLENGALSRWTYTNIALAALSLGEYAWAFQFLQEYAPLVPANHREGALNFNLARYFYDTGNYRQAMQHLVRMEYDDVLQNLMAKTILCKIYYEMDEYSALENQLDSIEIYLRRKKVLGYHKDYYSSVVRLMRKMLAVNPNDGSAALALRQQISAAPALAEREWFLKQLPE
ncbi:MAG: hypothetical protein IPH12_00380 [Saprospirales bacterium]|nr:hypothetical protein [Saprospirales bacterium]MBK8923919.1 hypothetical protein [Saprospirales bacterium]